MNFFQNIVNAGVNFIQNAFNSEPEPPPQNTPNYPVEITGQPATPAQPAFNPFAAAANAFNNFVTGVSNLLNPPPSQPASNPIAQLFNTGVNAVNTVINTFTGAGQSQPPPQTPPVDEGNDLSGNSAPPPPILLPDIGAIVDDFGETVSGMAAHPLAVVEFAGDQMETMADDFWDNDWQADNIGLMLANETDILTQEMLLTLQRDGMPEQPFEAFMAQFAQFGWFEESDARAKEVFQSVESFAKPFDYVMYQGDGGNFPEQTETSETDDTLLSEEEREVLTEFITETVESANDVMVNIPLPFVQIAAQLAPGVNDVMEGILETHYGYNIEFAEGSNYDAVSQATQLHNLARAQQLIMDTEELHITTDQFSQAHHGGQVTILLGADETIESAFEGLVNLPTTQETLESTEGFDVVNLGSRVSIATIVHEMFHQIDRHSELVLSTRDSETDIPGLHTFFKEQVINRQSTSQTIGFGGMIFDWISGEASGERDKNAEIFADLMMAYVLDQQSELFWVDYREIGNEINAVGFEDRDNARDAKCGIKQYFDLRNKPGAEFMYTVNLDRPDEPYFNYCEEKHEE